MSEKSSGQPLLPLEQRDIDFYGDVITAVLVEEGNRQVVYIPLRPVCDFLGVAWSAQRMRIGRDPVLAEVIKGVIVTITPSSVDGRGGGPQEMTCLPLDYINGWLFGINASRVKEEIRDRLIRYQRECYRVLADAFMGQSLTIQPTSASDEPLAQLHNMALVIAATTKEMLATKQLAQSNAARLDRASEAFTKLARRVTAVEGKVSAGTLTEEQAVEIKRRVNAIANEMAKHDPGKSHYQAVYAALGDEVGATSYKSIPMKGYESALAFLDNWLLAVQQAGKGEAGD